ncbi:MAG TPA: M56 family metallopeptidase [Gemmatimonadaceae bacterium]|nr:M56 family metallopeptidase [Gemmatimonadaceae bacterium]
MIAIWMGYSLAIGVLLGVAALAISGVLRLVRMPTRWTWGAALACTMALSVLGPFRSHGDQPLSFRIRDRQVAPAAVVPATPEGILAQFRARLRELRGRAVEGARTALVTVEHRVPMLDRWLAWGWSALSLALVGLLAGVHLRFRRLRRRWPAARIDGVPVRVSPALGPAVIGAVRPEIVVPAWLLERGAGEQSLVIAHEREHVRARDPLLLGAACCVAAVLPWHPAAWWMLSRLRLAVELDCDHRILRRGVTPRTYGTLLIDLAGRCSGFPAGAPALADTPSHLERRLVAMHPDRSRFPLARGAGLGALALVAVLAACEARMPTSADVDRMDVAAAERGATAMHLRSMTDSLATYTIDDQAATVVQAHALGAEQIASIEVLKHRAAGARDEIRITTREAARARGELAAGQAANAPAQLRIREAGGLALGDSARHGARMRVSEKTFDGLLLIDGVRSSIAAMHALVPADIQSVQVLKGSAAMQAYPEPAARNGVILITTNRHPSAK